AAQGPDQLGPDHGPVELRRVTRHELRQRQAGTESVGVPAGPEVLEANASASASLSSVRPASRRPLAIDRSRYSVIPSTTTSANPSRITRRPIATASRTGQTRAATIAPNTTSDKTNLRNGDRSRPAARRGSPDTSPWVTTVSSAVSCHSRIRPYRLRRTRVRTAR